MEILITAGGTSEYIDSVRKITNSSTGRLSTFIYKSFLQKRNKEMHIHYVMSEDALLPEDIDNNVTTVYRIKDTKSLEECLKSIIKIKPFDIIVHCMAVSDFSIGSVLPMNDFVTNLSIQLAEQLISNSDSSKKLDSSQNSDSSQIEVQEKALKQLTDPKKLKEIVDVSMSKILGKSTLPASKISSNDDQILNLIRTPKIIKMLRELNPEAKLVGFKLLNDVSEEHLINIASQLGEINSCEFVVANDLKNIAGDQHEALLVKNGKVISRYNNKKDLGEGIVDCLFKI
jgi:phosphopantothenate-cysteine ligase